MIAEHTNTTRFFLLQILLASIIMIGFSWFTDTIYCFPAGVEAAMQRCS